MMTTFSYHTLYPFKNTHYLLSPFHFQPICLPLKLPQFPLGVLQLLFFLPCRFPHWVSTPLYQVLSLAGTPPLCQYFLHFPFLLFVLIPHHWARSHILHLSVWKPLLAV